MNCKRTVSDGLDDLYSRIGILEKEVILLKERYPLWKQLGENALGKADRERLDALLLTVREKAVTLGLPKPIELQDIEGELEGEGLQEEDKIWH